MIALLTALTMIALLTTTPATTTVEQTDTGMLVTFVDGTGYYQELSN